MGAPARRAVARRHTDDRLGFDRSALEEHGWVGRTRRPRREEVVDGPPAGPVEDHAEGAAVAMLEHEHDGAVEVLVDEGRQGHEQPALQAPDVGHWPPSWRDEDSITVRCCTARVTAT